MILSINEEVELNERIRTLHVSIKHDCTNEGFFDAIKSVGSGIYRFIRNLIRKVIDFIKSIINFFVSKRSKLKRQQRTLKKLIRENKQTIESNPDRFRLSSIEVINGNNKDFIADKIEEKVDLTNRLLEEVTEAFGANSYITELNPRETFVSLYSILKEIKNAINNRSTVSGISFIEMADLFDKEMDEIIKNGEVIEANEKNANKILYKIEKDLANNTNKGVQRSLIEILKNFNEYLMDEKSTFDELYDYYLDVTGDMITIIKDGI